VTIGDGGTRLNKAVVESKRETEGDEKISFYEKTHLYEKSLVGPKYRKAVVRSLHRCRQGRGSTGKGE